MAGDCPSHPWGEQAVCPCAGSWGRGLRLESPVAVRPGGWGTGLDPELPGAGRKVGPPSRSAPSWFTSVPQAGPLVREPPGVSRHRLSVCACVCACVHGRALDRDGRLGLSMTNKDLIPVSLVGIFRMNVRFFSLLMSLRIKKNCDLLWTMSCLLFPRSGRHSLPGRHAARGGAPGQGSPLCPRWRARVTAFLPRAVTRQ